MLSTLHIFKLCNCLRFSAINDRVNDVAGQCLKDNFVRELDFLHKAFSPWTVTSSHQDKSNSWNYKKNVHPFTVDA